MRSLSQSRANRRRAILHFVDVVDLYLFYLRQLVKGLLIWVGLPLSLYLALIALPWGLYRVMAGYFFPATWPLIVREPGFWPVVAAVTFSMLALVATYLCYELIRGRLEMTFHMHSAGRAVTVSIPKRQK